LCSCLLDTWYDQKNREILRCVTGRLIQSADADIEGDINFPCSCNVAKFLLNVILSVAGALSCLTEDSVIGVLESSFLKYLTYEIKSWTCLRNSLSYSYIYFHNFYSKKEPGETKSHFLTIFLQVTRHQWNHDF
jgi:hypothetical protein